MNNGASYTPIGRLLIILGTNKTDLSSIMKICTVNGLPSGKRLYNYGKSPCLIGKSTISMAIFNSNMFVYQRVMIHNH